MSPVPYIVSTSFLKPGQHDPMAAGERQRRVGIYAAQVVHSRADAERYADEMMRIWEGVKLGRTERVAWRNHYIRIAEKKQHIDYLPGRKERVA